jgi:hypothetical protein
MSGGCEAVMPPVQTACGDGCIAMMTVMTADAQYEADNDGAVMLLYNSTSDRLSDTHCLYATVRQMDSNSCHSNNRHQL